MKKYPRTYHLPWSEGRTLDDKTLLNVDHFIGKEVVVTEKMDGENTSIYQDYIHARSLDSNNHPSRDWVKVWASTWQFELPDNYRICGENLYAKHSIPYNNLKSYFYGFSVWKDELCLSWKDTIEWFDLLGIVPCLQRKRLKFKETLNVGKNESVEVKDFMRNGKLVKGFSRERAFEDGRRRSQNRKKKEKELVE